MTGFDVGSRGRPADPIGDIGQLVHGLTWVIGPVAPRVALVSRYGIQTSVRPGDVLVVPIVLLNRQQSLVPVRVALSTLLGPGGVQWAPPASGFAMIVPETSRTVELSSPVPASLPPGSYRGTVVLLDTENGAIPLTIDLERPS